MKKALILGAGFSKNSNVPIQSEIPELLIKEVPGNEFENAVSNLIKAFITDVFGYSSKGRLPSLDDIFTCIDISTNSGHHLGIHYSPLELRAIRRFLVYRVFTILENSFRYSAKVESFIMKMLDDTNDVGFVVLNWDTVLERYLMKIRPEIGINYFNDGIGWREDQRRKNPVKIAKTHGSCNWLYCDNCRMLIYDLYSDIPLIERCGIKISDLDILGGQEEKKQIKNISCIACCNDISTHIATFSYRKSFRANSFPSVWNCAEKILSNADRWIFVGYSLPEADYEFKHLLKISELKFNHLNRKNLEIDLVMLNSDKSIEKYEGFFGKRINAVCNNGMEEYLKYVDSML